jgi:hypothetical protein
MQSSWIFLLTLLIFTFYIPFITMLRRTAGFKFGRKRFFRGIISVLQNSEDDQECVRQLQMLYRRIAERYPNIRERLRSVPEMMDGDVLDIREEDLRISAS